MTNDLRTSRGRRNRRSVLIRRVMDWCRQSRGGATVTSEHGLKRLCGRVGNALVPLAILVAPSVGLVATPFNAQSPLGMNLLSVSYATQEQPFLNIFKTSWISKTNPQGWQTHRDSTGVFGDTGEGRYVQIDRDGWPTSLTPSHADPNRKPFDSLGVLLLYNLGPSNAGKGPNYPAGKYVILYDGEGTLSVADDARMVRTSPGRDVVNVAVPTFGGGIDLRITSTDPKHTGNYLRNIRVVEARYEAQLDSGAIFNPIFLSLMQSFRALRGMQWLNIDDAGGRLADWSHRPRVTDPGWGGAYGTPIEVLLDLCNAVGADCWLNVPHAATDDYIEQMATLAHARLRSGQKVYVEYSNEVWNSIFPQHAYADAHGRAMWPNARLDADYGLNWYGMRTAQTCDIWRRVWGADRARVVCVMGAFADVTSTATTALDCPLWTGAGHAPCFSHGIGVVAIGPYFGYVRAQASWTAAADGGLSHLFQAINEGDIQTTSKWEDAYAAALARYKLPFVAYEGGQTLVSSQVDDPSRAIERLYIAANRDDRMGMLYTTALENWKSNGGTLYMIYADIYQSGPFGEWGALESLWDTVSPLSRAPPKWRALQNFIHEERCWWAKCAGMISSANIVEPQRRANRTAH